MPKHYRGQEAVQKYYDNCYLPEHRHYLTKERASAEVTFLMNHASSPPMAVCDVGCGAGQHLLAFAQADVPQGYGFDLSPILIKKARELIQSYTGYKTEKASFTDWNPLPGFYDIVYSLFSSFSYCLNEGEAQELISKMVMAAKPDGLICVDIDNVFRLMRALEGYSSRTKETNDKYMFDAEEMALVAEEKRDDMIIKTNTRYFMATDFTRWLVKAGIPRENVSFLGDLTGEPYSYAAKRLVVMARKNGRQ